jgi:uncharacterized membrane protein YqjE
MDSSDPMEEVPPLADSSRRLAHRLLTIGENRLQLLMVEVQEERARLEQAIAFGVLLLFFALLAGVALTLLIVFIFWEHNPIVATAILTVIYGSCATAFYVKLARLWRDWKTLPATLEQLKKDRECLENQLR